MTWSFSPLQKALSITVRDLGLQWWPSQVVKVKQLYSQLQVRHGVMLVGEFIDSLFILHDRHNGPPLSACMHGHRVSSDHEHFEMMAVDR